MASPRSYAGPERRLARASPGLVSLAALGVGFVAFATLSPIGLRPHLGGADAERFAAYFGLGLLLARAAGRRVLAATAVVLLLAFALEAAQRFAPGRHAHVSDAMVKALGGVLGCAAVQVMFAARRRLARMAPLRPEWSQG